MSKTPEQPRDRLEREINEILDHLPELPQTQAAPPLHRIGSTVSGPVTRLTRALVRACARVSATQLLVLGFVLIVIGFFFRGILPFAGLRLLAGGSLLLITSFALFLFVPSKERRSRRDRDIDSQSRRFGDAIRNWWRRLQQRH